MPKSRISPTPSINSIREDPVVSSNSSSSAGSKCQINQIIVSTDSSQLLYIQSTDSSQPLYIQSSIVQSTVI